MHGGDWPLRPQNGNDHKQQVARYQQNGAILPRCEVRKGTHGVRVVIPVESMVVQRFLPKPVLVHAVQNGKVLVDLVKEDLLPPWAFTVWIQLIGPVGVLDESTESRGILLPV